VFPASFLSPPLPSPLSCRHLTPEGQPSGRQASGGGEGGACGRVCTPDSGGCGNRPGDTTVPVRGARWEVRARRASATRDATRRIAELASRGVEAGSVRPRSAARSLKSPASGAPRGVRRVAQSLRAASWLNGSGTLPRASRRSAAPHFTATRADAGGRKPMRHSRAERSEDPGISGRTGAGASFGRRCSGRARA